MCDAPAVVVHGGSVRSHYPDRVAEKAYENAVTSIRECADTGRPRSHASQGSSTA
jgi:hypothetical protein